MARLRITQLRSGEGWILTDASTMSPAELSTELPDLLVGPLIVGSDSFGVVAPEGGRKLGENLYVFDQDAARKALADMPRWGRSGAIAACVPSLPDADARRRWIADPLRPWDAERLKATFYVQLGRRFQHHGVWFSSERDRQRWIQAAFRRALDETGTRMPNGDATIVFELPTDSTFEAELRVSGSGGDLRIVRDFRARGIRRTWRIERGDWVAEEKRTRPASERSLRERLAQPIVSACILAVSLPVFALVGLVAGFTRLTGGGATPSKSTGPGTGGRE